MSHLSPGARIYPCLQHPLTCAKRTGLPDSTPCRIELSQADGTHNDRSTARTEVAAPAVQPVSPAHGLPSPGIIRWTTRLSTVRSALVHKGREPCGVRGAQGV